MVGVGLDQPGYLRSKLYIVRHAGYNELAYCLLDKIRVSSSFFLKRNRCTNHIASSTIAPLLQVGIRRNRFINKTNPIFYSRRPFH